MKPSRVALASLSFVLLLAGGLAAQDVDGTGLRLSIAPPTLSPPSTFGVIDGHLSAIEYALAMPAPQEGARKNRRKGALVGGLIGAVVGGVSAGLSVDSGDTGPLGEAVEAAATGPAVVVGAIVGGAIGALLGATVFAPSGG